MNGGNSRVRTALAQTGFQAATNDFVQRFDCCRPTHADLIERLLEGPLKAQFCRGYLAMYVQHNLITVETADLVLSEIAPDSWRVRYLPAAFQ